jgi:hypothetical protein
VARCYGGIFDYDLKKERLEEVLRELEDPEIWNDQARAQAIAKEKGALENSVGVLDQLAEQLIDAQAMLDLAVEAEDEKCLAIQWIRIRVLLRFNQVRVVQKRRTGHPCSYGCICAGLNVMASKLT